MWSGFPAGEAGGSTHEFDRPCCGVHAQVPELPQPGGTVQAENTFQYACSSSPFAWAAVMAVGAVVVRRREPAAGRRDGARG